MTKHKLIIRRKEKTKKILTFLYDTKRLIFIKLTEGLICFSKGLFFTHFVVSSEALHVPPLLTILTSVLTSPLLSTSLKELQEILSL